MKFKMFAKAVVYGTLYGTLFMSCDYATQPETSQDYPVSPVDFTKVKLHDGFWKSRVDTVNKVTIPFAIKKCEETGRVNNFIFAAGVKEGKFRGDWGFDDSDVYKVLEGASYSLMHKYDPELDAYMDQLIEYIAGAQEKDGYLYTAWTLKAQDYLNVMCCYEGGERFTNLVNSHELYNLGHMYEAAVAHYLATGKRSFLNVAQKSADFIYDECITKGEKYIPGHQEIEIGLVRLFRVTRDKRYLDLAKRFLDLRGTPGTQFSELNKQAHKPVLEQKEAVGHAVRAGYMYTVMADIAALTGEQDYLNAIDTLWHNVVEKKLYINGGIGAGRTGEAFSDNYDLPNKSYAETCAAISNVFWNHRMFLLHENAKYIDVLERSLYNCVISGLSLDGTKFFYPNPHVHNGYEKFNKGLNGRSPWFSCSCCPSNLSRVIPSVAGYAYAIRDDNAYINLFMNSDVELETANGILNLSLRTGYPWKGYINIEVQNEYSVKAHLQIRIPGWLMGNPVPSDLYLYANTESTKPVFKVNGSQVEPDIKNGYASFYGEWQKGDVFEINYPMVVRKVKAHEKVVENKGLTSFEYGPILYCAEAVDNGGKAIDLSVDKAASFTVDYRADLLNGTNVLNSKSSEQALALVPYHLWNHRGEGEMAVWLKNK